MILSPATRTVYISSSSLFRHWYVSKQAETIWKGKVSSKCFLIGFMNLGKCWKTVIAVKLEKVPELRVPKGLLHNTAILSSPKLSFTGCTWAVMTSQAWSCHWLEQRLAERIWAASGWMDLSELAIGWENLSCSRLRGHEQSCDGPFPPGCRNYPQRGLHGFWSTVTSPPHLENRED